MTHEQRIQRAEADLFATLGAEVDELFLPRTAVRGIGLAVLRSPSPRFIYRRLLAQGLGPAEVAATPDSLVAILHLSSRRPDNASTVASLMHAITRFRRPRPESVLTSTELVTMPSMVPAAGGRGILSPPRARMLALSVLSVLSVLSMLSMLPDIP
jgi:hypothetical protein